MEPYNQIHRENLHRLQRAEKTMTDKACHKTEEQVPFKGRVASYRYYMQAKQSLEKRFETKCQSELYESQISKEKDQSPNDYLIQMKSNGVRTIPGYQAIRNKTVLGFCNNDFSVSTRKYIEYFDKLGQENQIWTKLYNKLIKMKNHIEALQAINTHAQQALRSVDAEKIKQTLDQISNKQQSSVHQILAMLTQIANKYYTEAQKSMKSLNLGEQQTIVLGLIRESLAYSKIEQISQGVQFLLAEQKNKLLTRSQYDMIQKYQNAIESVTRFTQVNPIIKLLAEKPQKYRDVCMKLPGQIEQGISKLVQQIQTLRKTNWHLQFVLQRLSTNKALFAVQQSQMDPNIRQAYKTILQKINSSTHTTPTANKAIPRTFEAYIQNQKIYIEQLLGSGLLDSECIRNYNPFQTGAEFISVSLNNLIEKMHSLKQLTIKLATFLDPQRQQQITKNEKELNDSKGEWTLTLLTQACHSVERRMEDLHQQNRVQHLQGDHQLRERISLNQTNQGNKDTYEVKYEQIKQLKEQLSRQNSQQKQILEKQQMQIVRLTDQISEVDRALQDYKRESFPEIETNLNSITKLCHNKERELLQLTSYLGALKIDFTKENLRNVLKSVNKLLSCFLITVQSLQNEIQSNKAVLTNQHSFLKGLNVQWTRLFENNSTKAPELYKDQRQLSDLSVISHEKRLAEIRQFVEGQLKQQLTVKRELHQSTDRLCRIVDISQISSEKGKSNTHSAVFSIEQELNRLKSALASLETSTKQSIQEQPNRATESEFRKLYEADIFAGSQVLQGASERVSVMEEIERVNGKKISKMNRLYRLDKRSKLSPHLYIDDKQNIVLLVRTEKDRIIGVYSSLPISKEPKQTERELGFLFKIVGASKNFYGILPNMNYPKYEQKYLIFGNSDIRVDIGDKSMTSNFGIQKSHYNCKKETVNDFIGQGHLVRQAKLVTYEVYEVIFQDEEKESKSQSQTEVTDRESNVSREQKFPTKFQEEICTKKSFSAKITEDQQLQLERDFKEKIKQIASLRDVIHNLQDQIKRHIVTKTTLEQKTSKLQNSAAIDKQQAQRKLKVQRLTIQGLKKKKGELQQEMSSLHDRAQGLKEKIGDLEKDLLREKGLREGLENQVKNRPESRQQQLGKKVTTLNQRIEALEKQIQNKKQIEHQLQSTCQQLKKVEEQNSLLQTQAEARQRQISSLSDKLKEKLQELEQSNNEVQRIKQHIRQQNEQIEGLELKTRSLMKEMNDKGTRNIDRFFVGEIMDGLDDEKKWLIENIEDRLQKRMQRTKLLYKFDRISNVNFHQYFDNHPNLLVIIKTSAGKLIGAFSQEACVPGNVSTGQGFIYSMSDRKFYGPNRKSKTYKAIIYDDYYLIFGNSELRLKALDDKVFSNFAIVNNLFETHGQNVDALLGEGEKTREVKLQTYEIFEIVFEV